MHGPYFIEVVARNGEVRARHQINSLPIRIGRSYDNDFIVDDLHTAAHHAIIEQDADGNLAVRDLGSNNGIIHNNARQQQLRLGGDTVFRLGHTRLRLRPFDFPVPPELRDDTNHGWEGLPPALLGLAMIVMMALASIWITDTEKIAPISYLRGVATTVGLCVGWCGAWALSNRLFDGQARFGRHLFITGCGLAALGVWSLISSVTGYAFSLESMTRYTFQVVLAIAVCMVMFHLLTIKPRHPRRFAALGAVLIVFSSAFTLMTNYQRTGMFADELYMSQLLPPAVRISPNHTVAQFMSDVNSLKAKVDEANAKGVGTDGPDSDESE
jgi:hypothetical protein